jgi:excisionase family DNA binding protein
MKLTLEQACHELGKSRRQVRYLIDQGRLKAKKDGGRWTIDSDDLPHGDGRKQARERRSRQMQAVVEDSFAADSGKAKRRYSVRSIKAFALSLPLRREVAADLGVDHPATLALDRMLRLLAQGCHRFEDQYKAPAYREARDQAALAVFELLLQGDDKADAWADTLEQEVMPAFSGLLRRLGRHRRPDAPPAL